MYLYVTKYPMRESNFFALEPDFEVDVKTGLREDEIIAIVDKYDALIVRSATKVTRRIIELPPGLRLSEEPEPVLIT